MSDEPNTQPAGEELSDEEFAAQDAGQTASDLQAEDVLRARSRRCHQHRRNRRDRR
jgi:hypothetical protein